MTGLGDIAAVVEALGRVGLADPTQLASLTASTAIWGPSVAAPYAAAAARHPRRIAVTDDFGSITYFQLDWRTTRICAGLQHLGIDSTSTVGILCRNHRGFVEANIAAAKAGARAVYLNTGLPTNQLHEVIEREGVSLVLCDREFEGRLASATDGSAVPGALQLVVVAPEDDSGWSFPSLPRRRLPRRLPGPRRAPDPIVLTSGTTGAPKGTQRASSPRGSLALLGVLESVPYRRGDCFVIPAPLFHAWGLSQLILAATIGGTVVLRPHFDPLQTLLDIDVHGADVLIAVPVMMHRMLDVAEAVELSDLRVTATSGSALPGALAERWMDRYGDNLFNLYGSTEVGQVSIASPSDLRNAPGTAGRVLRGVDVRIVDERGAAVDTGVVGRIVARSAMNFDGYTGGGTKDVIDGHMSIGDQGWFDQDGRLFVAGRVDDMIISGGENLYPVNIERCMLNHESVREVAVVGVPDSDLGQRVRAVIVTDVAPSAQLTSSIKQHVATELANYERPREYIYVDALPRNESGKVIRAQLNGPARNVPNRVAASPKKGGAKKRVPKKRSANTRSNPQEQP